MSPALRSLRKLGSAQRAVHDAAYHKSSREHWGVAAPELNGWVRALGKQRREEALLALADELWASDVMDARVAAGKLLAVRAIHDDAAVWQRVEAFKLGFDGWAIADSMKHAAERCLVADSRRLKLLDRQWTRDSSFWVRRAALVFTLRWTKPDMDPSLMLGWAGRYAADSEWFIQKAIGWWLRELSRHDPQRVRDFLEEHGAAMKPFARREATRKMGSG